MARNEEQALCAGRGEASLSLTVMARRNDEAISRMNNYESGLNTTVKPLLRRILVR